MVYGSHTKRTAISYRVPLLLSALFFFGNIAPSADSPARFERSYSPQGTAHVTISNVNGSVIVRRWDKRTILARASTDQSVKIEDQVTGDEITISARRNFRLGHANFEVAVPATTSLVIKNLVGDIELRGITGHVSVTSFDSNVRLINVSSSSVDVKVTNGDIYFDGELHEGGFYSLQSMRGDLDVTLPAETPFSLNARALSENINLGAFLNNLTGSSRGPKGVSGTYLKGGSRLTLTAYAGRILLHKK